jgi:hypothetical protein
MICWVKFGYVGLGLIRLFKFRYSWLGWGEMC